MFSSKPGCSNLIEQHFKTEFGVTVCSLPYRLPKDKSQIVRRELGKMLKMGVIEGGVAP